MRRGELKNAGFSLMDGLIAFALLGVVIAMAIPLTMQYLNRVSYCSLSCADRGNGKDLPPVPERESRVTTHKLKSSWLCPSIWGGQPECPHGGAYALIQPDLTGENNPRVVCSLHFWPSRAKTSVVDAALVGGWDMNEARARRSAAAPIRASFIVPVGGGEKRRGPEFDTHEDSGALSDYCKIKAPSGAEPDRPGNP